MLFLKFSVFNVVEFRIRFGFRVMVFVVYIKDICRVLEKGVWYFKFMVLLGYDLDIKKYLINGMGLKEF